MGLQTSVAFGFTYENRKMILIKTPWPSYIWMVRINPSSWNFWTSSSCRHQLPIQTFDWSCTRITFHTRARPAGIHLFKFNNGNTRIMREIYSKLTLQTREQRQRRRFSVFIVNFKQIWHNGLVFPLLILSKPMPAERFSTVMNWLISHWHYNGKTLGTSFKNILTLLHEIILCTLTMASEKKTNFCFLYGCFYFTIRYEASGYFRRKMKSRHRYLGVSICIGISISIAKYLCLSYKFFFWKSRTFTSNTLQ